MCRCDQDLSIDGHRSSLEPEDDWSEADIAAAHDEFGQYSAVDRFETVAENPAHTDAPDLFENSFGLAIFGPTRFDASPPVWTAPSRDGRKKAG
jgi:hypothetical protein